MRLPAVISTWILASFGAAAAVADVWKRIEAPGVHVGYVSSGPVLLSVACFDPETGNMSGVGLSIEGRNEGRARIRVDNRPARLFELKGGAFGPSDSESAAVFESLVADLRAGRVAVVEVSGARSTVSLDGSADAIGTCPISF